MSAAFVSIRCTPARLRFRSVTPILRSLGDLLREDESHVVEAPNGMTALARLEVEAFDLVLTDLAMPVGLITGFGDQLEPEKLERHGIRFVVAKPFSSEDLLQVVATALRGPEPAPAPSSR